MKETIRRGVTRAVILLVGMTVASASRAADGITEISLTCASVGCFAEDGPGYPVTISQPGSYRLTSNLSSTSYHGTFVEITASNVQLDLGGFSVGFCFGSGILTCAGTPSGTGPGINTASSARNVSIRNGTVLNVGSHGVLLRDSSRVQRMSVISSGSVGIYLAGSGNIVSDCLVRGSASDGIYAQASGASILRDSVVLDSNGFGLSGSSYLLFWANAFSQNNQGGPQIGGAAASASGGGFDNRCGESASCP